MHTCERSARVLIISIWWWCMNAYVHHPLLAHLVHLVYYWEPWFLSFSLFGKSRLIRIYSILVLFIPVKETIYANKCAALLTLVLIIAITFPLGFLPRVDNSAHIEGFLSSALNCWKLADMHMDVLSYLMVKSRIAVWSAFLKHQSAE
nr:rhomboid-like protein 5 [Quercus suber]